MPYSQRSDFPRPANANPIFYQPFTPEEWQASNFATEQELQWFRDARYGMFIHFGLSTFKNQDLSWGVCHTRKAPDCEHGPYPEAEWQSWAQEFRLEQFDARQWVEIARQAGCKYLVLIAKHHDGFHMWDTAESEFKVTRTPFGRDLVLEMSEACHAANMPFGIYYSQRDWVHPDYMPVDPEKVVLKGNHWTLKPGVSQPMGERHQKYLAYQERVVRELCTRYGKIDIFWWDAAWWGNMFTAEMWDGEKITRLIRELQPGIIINNRCSVPGDFDTPEGRLGAFQNWRPWESCICLTDSWSYSATPPKSLAQLIRMVANNACGDGNLLLSWGPHWNGAFDAGECQRLLEFGAWLKHNGTAIYGTRGGPWKPNTWGGSVHRGDTIYLHITDLPGEILELPLLPGRTVLSARLLHGDPVTFTVTAAGLRFILPQALRSADTIVEIKVDQPVDALGPVSTGAQSLFIDTTTYGQRVTGAVKVRVSSLAPESGEVDLQNLMQDQVAGDYCLRTQVEAKPYVELDLGAEHEVTGVSVAQVGSGKKCMELVLLVSRNGQEWDEVGRMAKPLVEMAINRYQAGAWIPGRPVRFLRIESAQPSPAALALRQVAVYARRNG